MRGAAADCAFFVTAVDADAVAAFFFSRADLIVAAPFYYDREAGGAVYVYSNPPEGLTAHTPPVRLLGKPESR